jgi:hypothetical protein
MDLGSKGRFLLAQFHHHPSSYNILHRYHHGFFTRALPHRSGKLLADQVSAA